MKTPCILSMAIVLGIQSGCTKSSSQSDSNLNRNSEIEFLVLAEVGKFNEDLIEAIEVSRDVEEARLNDLVKDANGVTVGRWVNLAREYVPEKGTDQCAYRFLPSQKNFIRDGSTGKPIELESFERGPDFEQHPTEFKSWLDAKKVDSVQILCEQPMHNELITRRHFQSVHPSIDEKGRPCVNFTITSEGAPNMYRLTKLNQGQRLGILFKNELHSAPLVETAFAKHGRITGSFTQEEVDAFVASLRR